jgi:hypothetical protein
MPHQSSRRRGSAMVEFVLVAAFFFVPLITGLLSYGFTLSRSLQVAQLTRDVGRMYVRGVDFSQQANQDLIAGSSSQPNVPALARGLGMQSNGGNATGGTSGNGVLILSTYVRLSDTCDCPNAGSIALMRRVVVGNKNLQTAAYGDPAPGLVDSGTGMVKNYDNNATARADGFSSVINLSSGELAYFVEARFIFPDLAIPGVLPNPGVAWRSAF